MSSPLATVLANLDSNLEGAEVHIERLHAGLLIDEAQVAQDLSLACHNSDLLRELIHAERPGAQWSDRSGLEKLLQDLERAARERLYEQRRKRLLELANELYAGTIRHRFAARTAALDALRQDALRELQSEAALPEQTKELPGPAARDWPVWAFNLQDEADAEILAGLRRDFAALERFTGEMEEDYWVPSSNGRGDAPPPPPAAPPAKKNVERSSGVPTGPPLSTRSSSSPATDSFADPVARSGKHDDALATQHPKPGSSPASAAITEAPQSQSPPAGILAELPIAEIKSEAAHSEARDPEPALSAESHGTVEAPLFSSFTAADSTAATSLADRVRALRSALRARLTVAWAGAAGFVLLSLIFFAGFSHLHRSSSGQPVSTVSAATAETPGGEASPTQVDPATGGAQPATAPSAPLLHRLPAEGAQNKILFSVEACGRGTPGTIECWGYASNLGQDTSPVALDRVDVVDGRGNTFTLDRNAQFGFTGGHTSSIPAGSRVKYSLKVPDQDAQARTLTLYVDLSTPHSLEYTFRDIPITR